MSLDWLEGTNQGADRAKTQLGREQQIEFGDTSTSSAVRLSRADFRGQGGE
jgi:hypothetical protein